jgi:hypothetical protein
MRLAKIFLSNLQNNHPEFRFVMPICKKVFASFAKNLFSMSTDKVGDYTQFATESQAVNF